MGALKCFKPNGSIKNWFTSELFIRLWRICKFRTKYAKMLLGVKSIVEVFILYKQNNTISLYVWGWKSLVKNTEGSKWDTKKVIVD